MFKLITKEEIDKKLRDLLDEDLFLDSKYRIGLNKLLTRFNDCVIKNEIKDPWMHYEFSVWQSPNESSPVMNDVTIENIIECINDNLNYTQINRLNFLIIQFIEYYKINPGFPRFKLKVFEFDKTRFKDKLSKKSEKLPVPTIDKSQTKTNSVFSLSRDSWYDSTIDSEKIDKLEERVFKLEELIKKYRNMVFDDVTMGKILTYFEILGDSSEAELWETKITKYELD
jgi:hypothetical protein